MNPFATATELLADLRAGRVTSSQLAEMYIGRMKHDGRLNTTRTLTINGQPASSRHCIFYPSVATLAGQPATAFPVGRSREGLPIGLQAIGPYLEDRTPIRFAALLAKEIGGFVKPEGYDASQNWPLH